MAQKVTGYIKLQIEAGKATPAPPVGPALGQKGVNIMAKTKMPDLNAASLEAACSMVRGTCRSMGVTVEG